MVMIKREENEKGKDSIIMKCKERIEINENQTKGKEQTSNLSPLKRGIEILPLNGASLFAISIQMVNRNLGSL